MSNEGWLDEVFNKKPKEKPKPKPPVEEKVEEWVAVEVEKKPVEEPVEEKTSWFSRIFKGWKAAKDVVTVDKTPLEQLPVENPPQRVLTGNDVMYLVPSDMNNIKVRILESNGRLKNQYTLTDYLSIDRNDKIHILVT